MKSTSLIFVMFFAFAFSANSQQMTVEGLATDSSNGFNSIEIVVNDTLSKLMANPKENRSKYLRIYQNPKYVVRTDSTGRFRIKAQLSDTLHFKSYKHISQALTVKELLRRKQVKIVLKPETAQPSTH